MRILQLSPGCPGGRGGQGCPGGAGGPGDQVGQGDPGGPVVKVVRVVQVAGTSESGFLKFEK